MSSTHFHQMHPRPWLVALLAGLSLLAFGARGSAPPARAETLLTDYQVIHDKLVHSPLGVPVYVRSWNRGDVPTAEVYGRVDYPLQQLKATLTEASSWCDLLSLMLNVKACVRDAEGRWLTVYMGREFYQPPDKAYRVRYRFAVTATTSDYFEVSLSAADGPLGTSDYHTILEAVSIPNGTLLHVRTAYRSSTASRLATSVYLATLGRHKIGFTPVGVDSDGRTVYVEGVRGTIERNAMRYYLALLSVLETRHLPAGDRFEARIQRWFTLTERFRPQLHEMDRAEYLQAKRQEHLNELRLQDQQAASASG